MRERSVLLGGHPALVIRPRGARALYVLAHGAGAGMRHPFMAAVATALGERGIATLRWEFRYLAAGRRLPPRADVAEAEVAEVWRAARLGDLPRFAGGKSFGGRMTSRAHARAPLGGLRGLIFLGFPLHPAGKPATERAEHLARAAVPMLFLQGSRDELAELELLRPIVDGLGATLHVIAGADHGFERAGRHDAIAELASTIAAWIDMMLACGPTTPRATRRS